MMAAMTRFTTRGIGVIALQDRYHSWVIGSLMTALVGAAGVAIVFNWGQVSLGKAARVLTRDNRLAGLRSGAATTRRSDDDCLARSGSQQGP